MIGWSVRTLKVLNDLDVDADRQLGVAVESLFGRFKRREGEQSRSGFTGLLATLPTLCGRWERTDSAAALVRTPPARANAWIAGHVGETLQKRRGRLRAAFPTRRTHPAVT